MKKIKIFSMILLVGLCYVVSSCNYDEAPLTASGIKSGYTVPQGNHDYDSEIVDFYSRYGSCLLYKFTDKDTYWTPSGWKNGVLGLPAQGAATGYIVTAADEQYVGKQLDLLNKLWFGFYSDAFLKKFLPVKVMLCSKVQSCVWGTTPQGFGVVGTDKPAYYNYDNICVSYGSSSVNNLTLSDSLTIAQSINRCFMESMLGRSLSVPTNEFVSAASYTSLSTLTTNKACWARGIFPPSYSATPLADWKNFLFMMVSYPESYLTRVPKTTITDSNFTETAWEGILNPAKDTNGLLIKRYTMVRNYFINNYGMDLQIIGNYNKNY